MPIRVPKGPEGGVELASTQVADILRTEGPSIGLFKDVRTEELCVADGHQVYFVSLRELASGKLLAAAQPVSWRYIVIQGLNAVGEVELTAGDSRTKLEFSGFYETPFANATLMSLRIAEGLPEIQNADYELRYLKIPAVYFAAVWLTGSRGDFLFPVQHPPGGLKENQAYSEKQILEALQPLAIDAQQFDATFEREQRKPKD